MNNVCILTSVHQALDTRVFYKEARSLVKAGYSVTLIAQHDKDEIIDGVKIIALPKPRSRINRLLGLTFKVFYLALKQKSEVYHFHDPELMIVGVLLKKLFAKRVICDFHEDYPKIVMSRYYIPESLRKCLAFSIDVVQKLLSKHFDYIVAAGDDIADNFRETSFYNKIVVLKNVPPKEFVEACAGDNERTSNRIVYAGGLFRGKGIKELVEAMKFVKNDVVLFLIGSFDTEEFEMEIRERSSERVKIIGQIPYSRMPDFLRTMRIGLLCLHPDPNHISALSSRCNKFYEYMSAGLGIVASNFPLWEKIIAEEKVGITVNPLDPKEIGSAIDYLLDHPDVLSKMCVNGMKAVRDKYNWEVEEDKLLGIYRTF